jgi:replicative superfamily II helicase
MAVQAVEIPKQGMPAKLCSWYPIPYEFLNPVQSAALAVANKDCNLLVAAATSAGKTLIAEMAMADALASGKRAIFVTPLKALTQEKYDTWTGPNHPFAKYSTTILTGDYQLTQKKISELDACNLALLTSEMLDSRTRNHATERSEWLKSTGILVIDEAHLLCAEKRGDNLEAAIMRFTSLIPNCRVILLSATMFNVGQLASWVERLNGKNTYVIQSDYRPCKLNVHFESYKHKGGFQYYWDNEENKIKKALEIVNAHPDDKFLIFVHSKSTGAKLVKFFEDEEIPTEFHSADLSKDKRLELETRFRGGPLRILVATSTLAYGLNLPARRVIVLGVHRGVEVVSPLDIQQEIGRSGRVGIDPEGDAYVLLPDNQFSLFKDRVTCRQSIDSRMNNFSVLCFHIVSEIHNKECRSAQDIKEWYSRSFAKHQGADIDDNTIETMIDSMKSKGILWVMGKILRTTGVGDTAALYYQDPFDCAEWLWNWGRVFQLGLEGNDIAIAWALGKVPTNRPPYVPKVLSQDVAFFDSEAKTLDLHPPTNIRCTGMRKALESSDDHGGWGVEVRGIRYDSDRLMETIKALDRMAGHWNRGQYWDKITVRLKYGCTHEEAGLVGRFSGIGAKKAKKLISAGIYDEVDILRHRKTLGSIVGPKTAKNLVNQILQELGD